MTRRQFLAAALATPFLSYLQQDTFTGRDVFTRIMAEAKEKKWRDLPMGELVGTLGMAFIDTPYVGFTLELFEDKEVCVINLAGLDCATLYEACLALARTIKSGRLNEAKFVSEVTNIRYRGRKLQGYTSRLHYASDYFYDNDRKGFVKLITSDLPGATLFTHKVSYMSQHPDKYRQLAAHPELVPEIAKTEEAINARHTFYLPKAQVADAEQILKTGDILGLTTTQEGLDCSHTGMCYRDAEGVLRFLHASSVEKKVVLGPRLSDYLKAARINDGIMVARPLEP